jgi:Mrp family chromosome partitioning ATPase/uncharacterized protein involved in exopolysaccharide biosynthesis
MTTRQKISAPPPASISLRDIYYVLFRHKWLTAVLVALGVGSSLAVYELYPFPYISEAKLYIRYVQDSPAPTQMEGNANVRSPDDRGANIMSTEVEMVYSLDSAMGIVKQIGPDKILNRLVPEYLKSYYEGIAANEILRNLKAEVPLKSDVILLHYSARTPELAKEVLKELIAGYETNSMANHLSTGINDTFLQGQTDEAKTGLLESMKKLEDEKSKAGITSLGDAKKNVTDVLFKKQESIDQVRAEMAETKAIIEDIQAGIPTAMTNASATNNLTNITAAAPPGPLSPDVIAKYQNLTAILTARRADEQKFLSIYTTNNPMAKNAQQQRAAAEANVEKFEAENPGLLATKSNVASSPLGPSADPLATLRFAESKLHSLMARYLVLSNQLVEVKAEAKLLDVAEDAITKAETEKEVAAAKYKHFLTSQEQARIDAAIGDKVSNITTAESATLGVREDRKVLKVTAGVLGFFLALAFGLPFFIEMVLDQSFKHPMDVKARIGAPFFITIPITNGHAKLAALKRAKPVALLSANGAATPGAGTENGAVSQATKSEVASWDQRHELRPFFEALRDRLMTYFEVINLTHKPKLVAVTSCGEGAGVTTTAAGLASSLSETGEGNVLLVNMNGRDGEAHHFYKGKLACGIEELLGREKRDQAQVHERLYVANEAESGASLPRVLPKRFSHLVPLMKASDYDYIIFDMPPVSEISITPRLARFMDMVLLVIESEKTSREAGMRAASLLEESKTNVGLVLNKNRDYLPKRLQNI